MPTITRNSFLTTLAFTSALSVLSLGCSDEDDDGTFEALAELNTTMEVPPPTGTTTASGVFAFEMTEKTGVMKYTLTVANLTGPASMGHIHKAPMGMAGPVVLPLMVPTTAAPLDGTVTLDAATLADLKAGLLYVNIHTVANPMGEIRGQLKVNN